MEDNTSFIKDPQIRRGILASIIASLIVIIFVQPLLRIIWSVLLKVGLSFFQSYVDSIYLNAARAQRNEVGVIILFLILTLIFSLFSGVALFATRSVFPAPRKTIQSKKRLLFLLWVCVFIIFLLGISIVITPFTNLQLNTSFQQQLTVLSPKISELERKEIEAEWALMKSRKDFEDISKRMNEIAKKHGVVLPPNLLK